MAASGLNYVNQSKLKIVTLSELELEKVGQSIFLKLCKFRYLHVFSFLESIVMTLFFSPFLLICINKIQIIRFSVKYQARVTNSRVKKLIVTSWVLSIVVGILIGAISIYKGVHVKVY